jgi:hypothetical protein
VLEVTSFIGCEHNTAPAPDLALMSVSLSHPHMMTWILGCLSTLFDSFASPKRCASLPNDVIGSYLQEAMQRRMPSTMAAERQG